MRLRVRRGIALLLAAVLAGCGGGGATADKVGRGVFDRLPGQQVSARTQPLTSSEQLFVLRVQDRLTRVCMKAKGFDYPGIPRDQQPGPATYLSPDQLRRSGYGFDFDAYASELAEANAGPNGPAGAPTGVDAESWFAALRGPEDAKKVTIQVVHGTVSTSATGCEAKAKKELFGSISNAVHWQEGALAGYAGALRGALKGMADYRGPLRKWRACMHEAGVEVGPEIDSSSRLLISEVDRAYLRGRRALPAGRVEAVAEADADCLESSGLYRVRVRLMGEAGRRAERSLGFEGGELAAFDQALLARAKRL